MDVLFDTINVRDLLSATDLSDPSSPLSAPDLRLLINRLDSHSQSIRAQVRSYLLSHQPEFSSLFSLCGDVVTRSDDVSGDFQSLMRLISDRPIDVEVLGVLSEIDERMKEVKVKKELLALVRAIWGLTERLRAAKEALRSGQLKFAAQELRELRAALRLNDGDAGPREREPLVYGLLKNEWHESFEEMQEVLSKFVDQAVQYDAKSSRIQVKYQLCAEGTQGVYFLEVIEALDVIGLLDYGLARVADLMIKYIITPVINSGSPIAFVEELSKDSEKAIEAILKIERSSTPETGDLEGETIFAEIIQVVKFTCEHICFRNVHWIQSFGRLAWPRISELIISNVLSKVVPEDGSKVTNFQKMIDRTTEFETALKDLSFISASDIAEQRLSNFAENVEVHFAANRKIEILAKARKLLLDCDFAIPQESIRKGVGSIDILPKDQSDHVVDLLFLSDRCFVSTAASELMKLVHQTLQDVCVSSTRVALELYHAARDAVLLYEAIVPVKQERRLDGINQVAVLMHNDFLYLSQEVLGLAFQYRPDFPDSLKERAVFLDLAPRFRVKAEEILQREIQVVIYNLKEAIDGADGFQNTHQLHQFESAKFSIDQVVFILEKVRIIWEPILLPSTYYKSMGTVLESVLSRIDKDILFLDDMAAEETLQVIFRSSYSIYDIGMFDFITVSLSEGVIVSIIQLQRLILLMLEGISSLLGSLANVKPEMNSKEKTLCSLDNLIPSLQKTRKLAELLDMPLRSITTAWESGELVSCGFTLIEVKDFIKAIFTDSPLRKDCLWRIENTSF